MCSKINTLKQKKILFAVSSLGLGHATRSLAIVKHFLKNGYKIDIISFGNALNYLKKELECEDINFMSLQDYPALERGTGIIFYIYLFFDLFRTKYIIKNEQSFIKKIENDYNFIFSDGRYGIYSKKIPSYLISHQLSFIMPKGLSFFQNLSDKQNIKYFKNFTNVLIPDYIDKQNNLAGIMSHPTWINKINYKYIGIISDFNNSKVKETDKIDYLFTITGYLQEHKQSFIDNLIIQAKKLKGKKVFVLGDTTKFYKKNLDDNIIIYSYVSKQKKIDLFKNSNIIISRSGYTTIMDLVELEKKAILFPTKNSTEQEYLAAYLGHKGYFITDINIDNLLMLIQQSLEIEQNMNFSKTKNTLDIIDNLLKN